MIKIGYNNFGEKIDDDDDKKSGGSKGGSSGGGGTVSGPTAPPGYNNYGEKNNDYVRISGGGGYGAQGSQSSLMPSKLGLSGLNAQKNPYDDKNRLSNDYRLSLLDPNATPYGLTRNPGTNTTKSTDIVNTQYGATDSNNIVRTDYLAGGGSNITLIPNSGGYRMTMENDKELGNIYNRQNSAYDFTTKFEKGTGTPGGFDASASQDWLNSNLSNANNLIPSMQKTDSIGRPISSDGMLLIPSSGNRPLLPTAQQQSITSILPATQQSFMTPISLGDGAGVAPTTTPVTTLMPQLKTVDYSRQKPGAKLTQNSDGTETYYSGMGQANWNEQLRQEQAQNQSQYETELKKYMEQQRIKENYADQQNLNRDAYAGDPTATIRMAQQMYAEAQAKGDAAGMQRAHAIAEQARAGAGWNSGSTDGSATSGLMTQAGLPTIASTTAAEKAKVDNAWEVTKILGYVPESLADIVKLPAGTKTNDAAYREESLRVQQENNSLDNETSRLNNQNTVNASREKSVKETPTQIYNGIYAAKNYYRSGDDYYDDITSNKATIVMKIGQAKYEEILADAEASLGENWEGKNNWKPGGSSPIGTLLSEDENFNSPTSAEVSGNVDDWIRQAMKIAGVGDDWYNDLAWLVQHESGGNPGAKNSQTAGKTGEHAQGLMQTIPSTFKAHAKPGMTDINNPVHNLVAAIGYIKGRYKHPSNAVNGWGKRGGY